MSHMLLIWLLILVGPFVAVAPPALATLLQLEPQHRGHRHPASRVRPVRAGGWAVAW